MFPMSIVEAYDLCQYFIITVLMININQLKRNISYSNKFLVYRESNKFYIIKDNLTRLLGLIIAIVMTICNNNKLFKIPTKQCLITRNFANIICKYEIPRGIQNTVNARSNYICYNFIIYYDKKHLFKISFLKIEHIPR